MAEEDQVSGGVPVEDEEIATLPIVRDPTFVRITADQTLVIDRGSEVEIAMLVQGPDPISFGNGGKRDGKMHYRVQMSASYSEVARIRMDHEPAVGMAMNIVRQNLEAGRIDVAAFRAAMIALADEHEVHDDENANATSEGSTGA